ncbi:MAG: hypothetical protein HUU20_18810 [Pirellulales bacterium]|nr:hypothetical protein [Pirellulales bacterium]
MSQNAFISRRRFVGGTLLSVVAASAATPRVAPAAAEIAAHGGKPQCFTLFALDDVSIPFRQNLRLTLHPPRKHAANPVLRRGGKGTPDDYRAQFYGSVIREGGKFRMWYIAIDEQAIRTLSKHAYRGCRAAYAESDDGIHWVKPNLGLVEHGGSRNNNLVLVDPPDVTGLHLVVLHEPDDPDPARRYKMMHQIRWAEAPAFGWTTSVPLFSADGFHWKLETPGSPRNYAISTPDMPLPPEHTEQSGLYKWDGLYYLTGQQLSPWVHFPDGSPCGRVMTSFHSADFVHWSHAKTLAYHRSGYTPAPQGQGKESHSPASVWHRGNVLIGLHGLWEGSAKVADRRMPLGLLISNDGRHFREPVVDSPLVPFGDDGQWDQRGLLSGQGFEQVGDETYIWYGNWDLSATGGAETYGGVGLLTMRRDGFGSLSPLKPGDPAQLVTDVFPVSAAGLSVNADGISGEARLKIELLDPLESPIPQYSGENAAVVTASGVLTPVRWPNEAADLPDRNVRVRIRFEGSHADRARLYALYIRAKPSPS